MSLNFTEEDKKTILSALASGAVDVSYSDKKITYRSLNEIVQILSIIEKSTERKRKSFSNRAIFGKGIFN